MKKVIFIVVLLLIFAQEVNAKNINDKRVFLDNVVNMGSVDYIVEKVGTAKISEKQEWIDYRFSKIGEKGVIIFDDKGNKDPDDDEIVLIVIQNKKEELV